MLRSAALLALLIAAGCASVPAAPPPPPAPVISLDQKIAWILRLEQQRVLADPDEPPAGAVPAQAAATPAPTPGREPGGARPSLRADLAALARDPDPLVRRRAVTAIGRVGMPEGVAPAAAALQDPDEEVRASAAFALGLLGAAEPIDPPESVKANAAGYAGTGPLLAALQDPSLLVQARAIDALGLVGNPGVAGAVAQAAAGCAPRLAAIAADDEVWPKTWEVEVCRLALFALVRLQDYGALAAVALDPSGRPVSEWWPVAYALQRINDPRAAPALRALAASAGVYTAGFAVRGLAALKDPSVAALATILAQRQDADLKLRIAAVRALGQTRTTGPLRELLVAPALPVPLLIEIVTAIGAAQDRASFDVL
jgi:HEAT repeat protein